MISKRSKICTGCGRELPLGDFYKGIHGKYGRASECKYCARAYQALPERKAAFKKYRAVSEGKVSQARYKASLKGKIANARYQNSAKGKAASVRFENSKKGKALRARWSAKRRAIFTNFELYECTFTAKEREELYQEQGGCCAYCFLFYSPSELENDHRMPLSRGGVHTKGNIALACQPCNRRKYNRTPEEFCECVNLLF